MPDIGKAFIQIEPTTKGLSAAIAKELEPAADAGDSIGKGLVDKIKGALKGAAIGAAVGKAIQASLEAGGALQQSFGGLETLYGDAADQAKEFAMQAAQAGISANDYAEQAVSFGASLKAAFGGDTVKAAEAANTAIMDMADNSAKMGTDITAVQSAYAGFAKQNYTMLDNLKLGYGGTKTEMERLLKDAEKLSGVKYDINNLGDVYDAIHVIQTDLGLTGVAAQEASSTLTGAFGAAKASLTNFLAALSTGGDVSGTLSQLLTSVSTLLFNNVVPMVMNIVMAIPPAITTALQAIAPMVGTAFQTAMNNLPQYLNTGVEMVNGVVNGILQGLPGFMSAGFTMLTSFVTSIVQRLPVILSAGVQIVLNLVNGIIQNLPQIVGAAGRGIAQFIAGIGKVLPSVLQSGVQILAQLVVGIINSIPKLVAAVPQCISAFKRGFQGHNWGEIGTNIINGLVNGIKNGVGKIADAAKNAAKSALDAAKSFLGIKSPSKVFEKEVGYMITAGVAKGINKNSSIVTDALDNLTGNSVYAFSAEMAASRFDTATGMAGGFNQTLNIYSPRELTPSEVARQTRNATQQMVLSMGV